MTLISQILAIVALYKQDIESSETLITLNRAVLRYNSKFKLDVYVYDNSPHIQDNRASFGNLNIIYVHDKSNIGVSGAYNRGVSFGGDKKKWVFLLDQDTTINQEYFYVLEENINDAVSCYFPVLKTNDQIISPCLFFHSKGFQLAKVKKGKQAFGRKNFLNSGTLVSVKAFKQVNGYNEKIPLYFSDFDFFERLKRVESEFILLPISFMHSLSSADDSNLQGFMTRFAMYRFGLRDFIKANPQYQILGYFFLWARAFKHTLKHKNLTFLKIVLSKEREIEYK